MSDEEIEAMAAQLEASARVEEARSRLEEFLDFDDGTSIILFANRAGFIQTAVLMLRGAIAEENVASSLIPVTKDENDEWFFDKVERRENWDGRVVEYPDISAKVPFGLALESICSFLVAATILFLIIVGAISVWKWIF